MNRLGPTRAHGQPPVVAPLRKRSPARPRPLPHALGPRQMGSLRSRPLSLNREETRRGLLLAAASVRSDDVRGEAHDIGEGVLGERAEQGVAGQARPGGRGASQAAQEARELPRVFEGPRVLARELAQRALLGRRELRLGAKR